MDDTAKSIRRTFAIAHNWRDSQGYPMNRFRGILNVQIKKNYMAGELEREAHSRYYELRIAT